MNQSNGKKALVTGGSRGIGRGIAIRLAAEGYDLAITYSSREQFAHDTAAQISKSYGRQCVVIQASLDREDVPKTAVAQAWDQLGQIDLLVNNAGVTIFDRFVDMRLDSINALINLDLKAYLLCMQETGRRMLLADIKGNIVNITSTRGIRAYPEDAVYGAVKAALHRASQSIALELAPHGIRVNCVAPGMTDKSGSPESQKFFSEQMGPRIPLRRVAVPDDVANAVIWLASDNASYITGEVLTVCGGLIIPGMPEDPEDPGCKGWA